MTKFARKYRITKLLDNYEVVIAANLEEIESLRSVWKEMQTAEAYPTISADIDRYISVVLASADTIKPHVILIKQDSRPIALIVARIEEIEIKVRFGYKKLFGPKLKSLTVVHGGIIACPSKIVYSLVLDELSKVLRSGQVDVLYFNHLRTDSSFYRSARTTPSIFCRQYFPKIEPHWQIRIPEKMEHFYKSLSGHHAKVLRQTIRKLEKPYSGKVKIKIYNHRDEVKEMMEVVSQISAQTYQKALGASFIDKPEAKLLLEYAAKNDWLCGYVLFVDDEPVAFNFGLLYSQVMFGQQMGYDSKWKRFSVGTVLFLKILEELCANPQVDVFDLGFGDAWYKNRYGAESWPEASIYIFAPKIYPICVNLLDSAFRGLSLGSAAVAKKIAVIDWVKRHWRDFLRAKAQSMLK